MLRGLWMCVLVLVAFGVAMPVAAQDNGGARFSGSLAAVFGEGETNLAVGGSAGYRFTPHFGVDFEALVLPGFEVDDRDADGRGVAFLTHFVTELPTSAGWLIPYVQGGGGVANFRRTSSLPFLDGDGGRFPPRRWQDFIPPGLQDDVRDRFRGRAETGLVLSIGGGVDFGIGQGFAVGPTISYMKFFGSFEDLDLTRIGGRATYRF